MARYTRPPVVQKVYITTHSGRLLAAHLSLEGKRWRSATSDNERQLVGAPVEHFFPVTYPSDIDYAIVSQGETIAIHNKNAALNNAKVQDPRKQESEWNVMPKDEALRKLNPTQINHLKILYAYLFPQYSWEELPPYVNDRGELPYFMRTQRVRTPGYKRPERALNDIEDA